MYGLECVVDIHNVKTTFSREKIEDFCGRLCEVLDMERVELIFWELPPEEYRAAPPHLKGLSAVQFIKTSNITIHSLDDLHCVYLNIFSCKDFSPVVVRAFLENYVDGDIHNFTVLTRI